MYKLYMHQQHVRTCTQHTEMYKSDKRKYNREVEQALITRWLLIDDALASYHRRLQNPLTAITAMTDPAFATAAGHISGEAAVAALAIAVNVSAYLAGMAIVRHCTVPYSACNIVRRTEPVANVYERCTQCRCTSLMLKILWQ